MLVWDPAMSRGPARSSSAATTAGEAVAVLPDGRVVTGGAGGGPVLVWDPDEPGTGPVELGRHDGLVTAAGGAAGRAGDHRQRRRYR